MSKSPPSARHSPTILNISTHTKNSFSCNLSTSAVAIRRSLAFRFGLGFTFAFVAFTLFFFFNTYSFPTWFKNRSHFLVLITTSPSPPPPPLQLSVTGSHTPTPQFSPKNDGFSRKISSSSVHESASMLNHSSQYGNVFAVERFKEEKKVSGDGFLLKNESREAKQRTEEWLDLMNGCDIYDGSWVRDDSYPLFEAGSCPHIDEQFNCFLNGRRDNKYENFRWQPNGCNIPR